MAVLSSLGALLGTSWASGVNIYLTVAVLGIAQRAGWVDMPGNMDALSGLPVIIVAIVIYAVEFFADKIPYVDSTWDAVHTVIRPAGGALLAYMAMSDTDPAVQIPLALLCGAVSMDSHLTKATSRLAINASPEPITNSVASILEDGLVAGALFLVMRHPIISGILVILFILFSIWFLRKMSRFLRRVFRFILGSGTSESQHS